VRENRTQGSVRGRSGNWLVYLDGIGKKGYVMSPQKAIEIEKLRSETESIVNRWGLANKEKKKKILQIEEWFENFESPSEIKLAFKILNAIQYKSAYDIEEKISELAGNLTKIFENNFENIVFFPLGRNSNSSGGMFLYQYSKNLGWSVNSENFPYDDFKNYKDKIVVFFDDMIGSGNQAIKFAKSHLQSISLTHKPYYAAVYGFTEGINKIKESGLYEEVLAGGRITSSQLAFHDDSNIFDSDEKNIIQEMCYKYGKELYPEGPLGYDNSQALLAFQHNTPNNTIPLIWAGIESESNPAFSWKPLFTRKKIVRKSLKVKTDTEEKPSEQDKDMLLGSDSFLSLYNNCLENHISERIKNVDIYNQNAINDFSELYKLISTFDSSSEDENIFDTVLKRIENSTNIIPYRIDGNSGTGKSAFLSMLYLYACKQYSNKQTGLFPVLISLSRYNSIIYDDQRKVSFEEQALNVCKNDLAPLLSIIKSNSCRILFIIDGYDEYAKFRDIVVDYVSSISSECDHKKIIGIRLNRPSISIGIDKISTPHDWRNPEFNLTFHEYTTGDSKIEKLVLCFINAAKHYAPESDFSLLAQSIKKLKTSSIDLFTITLISFGHLKQTYFDEISLTDYLLNECEEFFLSRQGAVSVKPLDQINKASRLAFKWEIRREEILTNDLLGDPCWVLIHKHSRIRDFLVAKYIVNLLVELGTKGDIENLSDGLSFVYPYRINQFCKDLINENRIVQKHVYNAFEIILKFELTGNEQQLQSHVCYLAGRLNDKQLKEKSKKLLMSFKDKQLSKYYENKQAGTPDKPQLHLLRTIFISLSYLGDDESIKQYLKFLLSDFDWDNLNRGFHLEYYGDIFYDPEIGLLHNDTLDPFPNTFWELCRRIKNLKNNPLFEIDVHTLLSLAQHRHACCDPEKKQSIDRIQITKILELIDDVIHKNDIKSMPLIEYIKMVKSNLSVDKYPLGCLLERLYKLKDIPRKGWVERNINGIESVAEHTYFATLLARIFLPNEMSFQGYNKSKIIDMLFIHDLGEIGIGDLLPEQQNEESHKNEHQEIINISMHGTYSEIYFLRDIEKLWDIFDSNHINSKLAHDFDKLDMAMQLHIFYKQGKYKDVVGYKKTLDDIYDSLTTEIGTNVFRILNQHFVSE
jgi:5'-deoxynucleotidase YfbR-like HD superfamily hydrolase